MHTILTGVREALELLFTLDPELAGIIALSLKVSAIAVVISLILGIPSGIALASAQFAGRRIVVALVNTGMGMPPVLAGLVIYLLLARSGPLGHLNLIYTPLAIIIAQVMIAYPLIAGLTMAALQSIDPGIKLQALGLGASRLQLWTLLLREARYSGIAAIIAAFGAVISEVGAVMIVGGDIKGETRVMTTAIVLETRLGNFERAIAIGLILLLISFLINLYLTLLQQKGRQR